MASFGAKYPYFNQVQEETEGKLPTYKNPEPVRIIRLVKADLTVNLTSGKLFVDGGLAESVDEFSTGSIAMETDNMEDTVSAEVYEGEVVDKEVHYNIADELPAGGLSKKETLLSTPGEVGDLWELYLRAHIPRKKPEGWPPPAADLDSEQLFFLCLKLRLRNGSTIQKGFILQDLISGGGYAPRASGTRHLLFRGLSGNGHL